MDKYDFEHAGDVGLTYKVRNKMTGEISAMKCFCRGRNIDKNQIMNHKDLQHPNIIEFKEVVSDDYKLGIVIEYVKNDLGREVQLNGPFDETKARKMFQMLIAGLSYLHSKDICHRRLKLNNILLTDDNILKLSDFGSTKSLFWHLRDQKIVESPEYSAPEVPLIEISPGSTKDGKLADIWSCGVILYEMSTCRGVLCEANPTQYINSLRVSDECKSLLHRILVANPDNRITIEEIKKHPWYLTNLPEDLTDEAQAIYYYEKKEIPLRQSEEEILKIIKNAEIKTSDSETDEEADEI